MHHAALKLSGAVALTLVLSLFTGQAFSQQSKVKNDSVGETVNGVSATASLISGEMYEAVFDIPQQWITDSGGQIEMLGVEVLMVGGCHQGGVCSHDGQTPCSTDADCGTYCGLWQLEVWDEPAMTVTQPQTSCPIVDQNLNVTYPEYADPGNVIFSMTQTTPMLGFQIDGQSPQGNAVVQQLLFSKLNQNPNVTINPIMLSNNRVRVGVKALEHCVIGQGQSDHFPILVTDQDGVSARGQNFIYGSPTYCSIDRHFVWEDFAPAFKTTPGDWVLRLLLRYGTSTGGGEDMGSGSMDAGTTDAGTMDMSSTADMSQEGDLGMTGGGTDLGDGSGDDTGSTSPDQGVGAGLVVESITPARGPYGSSVDVVILGDGFEPGAEVLLGAENIGVTETRTQRIRATVPDDIPIGVHDVIVSNPDGTSARLPAAFEVYDPSGADMGAAMVDAGEGPADPGSTSGVEEGCGCDTSSASRVNLYGILMLMLAVGALAWSRRRPASSRVRIRRDRRHRHGDR